MISFPFRTRTFPRSSSFDHPPASPFACRFSSKKYDFFGSSSASATTRGLPRRRSRGTRLPRFPCRPPSLLRPYPMFTLSGTSTPEAFLFGPQRRRCARGVWVSVHLSLVGSTTSARCHSSSPVVLFFLCVEISCFVGFCVDARITRFGGLPFGCTPSTA